MEGLAQLVPFILIAVVFWLLLIRPQRRRQRVQQDMHANLRVGDEIVTAGGIYGDITAIEGDEVYLEIADGVQVRVARRAVAGVMPGEQDEDEEPEDLEEGEQLEAETEDEPEAEEPPPEPVSKSQDGS